MFNTHVSLHGDDAARRPTRLAVALGIGLAAFLGGCRSLGGPPSGEPGASNAVPGANRSQAAADSPSAGMAVPAGLGDATTAGVVVGRLIDGVTGLAVRDAGVALLELGRRTVSAPGGHFRFDGVAPGRYTLVVGPAEGYLPVSRDLSVAASGLNAGLVPVVPSDPAVLIVPDYGGKVAACGGTQVLFPTSALAEPTPVQLTCMVHADALPAAAPPGRLPLAAVDIAPGEVALAIAGRLTVDLPAQPRYGTGVKLDLLRLDLNRLIWIPTASLTVDAGGRSASGTISALGTYLVAAPPFGTFRADGGGAPAITRMNTSGGPQAGPQDVFAVGTAVVHLSLDYAGLSDTNVRIRTTNPKGEVLFESERTLTGDGHDDLPMAAGSNAWPVDHYLTTVDVGTTTEPSSVSWRIAAEPTPVPAPPTLPAVRPGTEIASTDWPSSAAADPGAWAPAATGCQTPAYWYAYRVLPGETLYGLALNTGVDAGFLAQVNCLDSLMLQANQLVYVPNPPRAPKPVYPGGPLWSPYPNSKPPAYATSYVPKPGEPPNGGSNPFPPTDPGYPTPGGPTGPGAFPTPGSGWNGPGEDPNKGLRGPEPTLAPRPVLPAAPAPFLNPQPPAGGPPAGEIAPQPQRAAPPPAPAPIPFNPPPAGGNDPAGGGSGNKGSRGPEPTLAPRP